MSKVEAMNDSQRQFLIKQIEHRQSRTTGEEDDILDNVRLALKKWDLQGEVPYAAQLLAWGLDPDTEPPFPVQMTPAPQTVPVMSEADAERILRTLREQLKTAPDEPNAEAKRTARDDVKNWLMAGRLAPLPHADELVAWGIWPPAPEPTAAPQPEDALEPVAAPDADAELWSSFESTRRLSADNPYQAIQNLTALQPSARGDLVKKIAGALAETRVELQRRTEALLIAARRVVQESPKDLQKQAEAWRAVTTLNPESLEAQETLQKLQERAHRAIETEMHAIEQAAQDAAKRDHLPDLNAARGEIQALVAREDLPKDLVESAQSIGSKVLALLAETRDRLGVASTKKVQGDLRESYKLAHESLDKGIPRLFDTGGVVGPAGQEVDTNKFFNLVSSDFLRQIGEKVQSRLDSARATEGSAPDTALTYLDEARGWLTDEVWTPDHRQSLRPQLEEVERKIKAVDLLLTKFKMAQNMVTVAKQPYLPEIRQLAELLSASLPDTEQLKKLLSASKGAMSTGDSDHV